MTTIADLHAGTEFTIVWEDPIAVAGFVPRGPRYMKTQLTLADTKLTGIVALNDDYKGTVFYANSSIEVVDGPRDPFTPGTDVGF